MDDWRMVKADNPIVTGQFSPFSIWFQKEWPLSWFVLWAQWNAWGAHPIYYHLVNIIFQTTSAVLLWRVLAALEIPGAWFAAAIYAIHPVCANSVSRIAEMKNTLSLPLFLFSLWLYLPNLTPDRRLDLVASLRYGLSVLAFVLALLAKTSTIMLPVILLVCALWRNGRIRREDLLRTAPFFFFSFVFGLMSSWFQKHQQLVGMNLRPETFWERFALAGRVFWFYLGKALLPVNLNLVYPDWKANPSAITAYIPDALFCVVMLVCWRFRRSWGRHLLLGLGIYAVTLFPVLGFFDSQFLTRWRVSDHLQYLPLIAPVALAVAILASTLPAFIFRAFAVMVILAFSCLTFQRARVFSSEENLFQDTLAKNPAAWGIQSDYGALLAGRKDFAEAEKHFDEAVKYNPDYPEAQSNLGQILAMQGKFDEAEPRFLAALKLQPNDAEAHQRYATLLLRQGRIPEGLAQMRMALDYSASPKIETRLRYASLLHQSGDLASAIAQYRAVLAVEPNSVEALNNLAWILATSSDDKIRNGAEAVQLAERASRLPPAKGMCVPGTLAAAYAEAGRFQDAIATAEQAVKAETAAGETQFAAMNQQLLNFYRAGQPFHQPP